jgi:hypothetical protein
MMRDGEPFSMLEPCPSLPVFHPTCTWQRQRQYIGSDNRCSVNCMTPTRPETRRRQPPGAPSEPETTVVAHHLGCYSEEAQETPKRG